LTQFNSSEQVPFLCAGVLSATTVFKLIQSVCTYATEQDDSIRTLLASNSTDKSQLIDKWIGILKKEDILTAKDIYDMESNRRIDSIHGATEGLKDVLLRARASYSASTASKNITPIPDLQPIDLAQYSLYRNNVTAFQAELRVALDQEAATRIVNTVCKHIEKIMREAAASNGMADGTGGLVDSKGFKACVFGSYLRCPALKANLGNKLLGDLHRVLDLRNELAHPSPRLKAKRYCDTNEGLEVCGIGMHLLSKLRPPPCDDDAVTSSSSLDSDDTLIAEDRKIHSVIPGRLVRLFTQRGAAKRHAKD
jgi:hypothetical protein